VVCREGDDPIARLRAAMGRYAVTRSPGLPRFAGGAVGYVGYEAARSFERLPAAPRDPHGLPIASFGIYDTLVAFDHVRHALLVIAHAVDGDERGAQDTIARIGAALDAPLDIPPAGAVPRTLTPNGTPAEFMARVELARDLIMSGDCIQIVVAQRFDVSPSPDPLALYRSLRHVNPSPYMFLLTTPEATIVGASPEPFVRVTGDRVVMHPIAGTRPRGADEDEDRRNEEELRASEKERAEHVMLVDLARQRHRPGVTSRVGERAGAHAGRPVLACHASHLGRRGRSAAGARRARCVPGLLPGGDRLRSAEDPRDGAHR